MKLLLPICLLLGAVPLFAQDTQQSTPVSNATDTVYTFPTWMVGAHGYMGFGNSDGLAFGYYDTETGSTITVDPGASAGFGIFGYRQIKSVFVVGAELGFSKASALSGVYSNMSATMGRGITGEVSAGVLLFTKHRSRCLLTIGSAYYSKPVLELKINDPNGLSNATFNYKPAFGAAINAKYILVLKKRRGELTFGLKYHQIGLVLDNFEADGTVNEPELLNPLFGHFKNPDASNMGVIFFGYQYSF